jgi:hypothetical protein
MRAKKTYKGGGGITALLLETGTAICWVVTTKSLSVYLQIRKAAPLYRRLI